MKITCFFMTFLLLTGLITAQDRKAFCTDETGIAMYGYSPVSYLDLNLAQLGDKHIMTVYEGLKFYFTSKEQQATFEDDPERYLPQQGGFCSMAMYHGKKVWVDHRKFVVRNGKYYLFSYDNLGDGKQGWLAGDPDEREAVAAKNWSILKNKY